MRQLNRCHRLYFSALLAYICISHGLPAYAQTYEASLINRGQLFASGALLQDYDDDGDPDIVIIRKRDSDGPGGIEWLENDGTGRFPRHELVDDLSEPAHIEAGDLDDDGDLDYVVADIGPGQDDGELVLFERQDDGSYIKWTLQATRRFDEVDLADFDDDGDLDVVGVGFWQETLRVWFNEGDLNFTDTVINEAVSQLEVVEASDVDNDGDIDILVDDMLLKNDGNGGFDDVTELYTGTGLPSAGRDFVVDDLDNDGVKDIITFRTIGTGGLFLLHGANDYTPSSIDIDGIDLGGSLIVADLDANGYKDIIRQNFGDEYVAVLYQDAPMSFRKVFIEKHWDSDVRGNQMALGDIDDDGDSDLIFPENGNVDGDISWFENINGDLYRHYLYNEIQASRVAKLGDMDDDGDLDVVLGAGNDQTSTAFNEREIVLYENRGALGFFESRIDDEIYYPADLELADLNGDQKLDVVASAEQDNSVYWYKKNGLVWERFFVEDNANLPRGIAVANVDSEGLLDVVLATSGDNKVFWYRNDGNGDFTRGVVDANLSEPLEIEAADFDDDGDTDLVVIATDPSNAVALYTNDGSQNFERQILYTGHVAIDVEVGDWTGNGAPDILVGFNNLSAADRLNIALFTNDGNGGFSGTPLYSTNQELAYALKLVDTDHDEDLDLVFAMQNVQPALAILPNENGVAGELVTIRGLNTDDFSSIDAGDIDDDGDVDLVAAGSDSESLALFTNQEFEPVAVEEEETPSQFVLRQNYPNPFNPSTQIGFSLSQSSRVELIVFDLLGREVAKLLSGMLVGGEYTVTFEDSRLPSGVYIYRLSNGDAVQTKKMVLLR